MSVSRLWVGGVRRPGRRIATALAVVVAVGAVAFVGPRLLTPSTPPPIVSELETLRDDQGLFFRPGLRSAGQPNVADTAYGFGVLAAAHRPVPSLMNEQVDGYFSSTVESSSVWGRWYLLRIEAATGQPIPGAWAQDITGSLRRGYFHDSGQEAEDPAADLASTAAALEVVTAKRLILSQDKIEAIVAWVTDALVRAQNPYQACNAVRSLRAIGGLGPVARTQALASWVRRPDRLPRVIDSFEGVLDLYGMACLMDELSEGNRAPVRSLLTTTLPRAVDDLQLLYHVAEAWRLVGGDPNELLGLAQVPQRRLDRDTGLVKNVVRPVGTLENSYYAMQIRRLSGLPGDDDRLAKGVRELLAERRTQSSVINSLFGVTLLRATGHPDARLQDQLVALTRQQLAQPVTRDGVVSWVTMQRLLADLELAGPPAEVVPWVVGTPADRDLVWLLLDETQRLRDQTVPGPFADTLAGIPSVLRADAASLSVGQIRAGATALAATGQADRIPAAVLADALDALRGCDGFADLYWPYREATTCDLRATADAIFLRNLLHLGKDGEA